MVKKQLFSISLIFIFLSLIWYLPGVSASTPAVQQIETVTPTPTAGNGIAQLTTFGSPEIGHIFPTGDQNKLFFTFDKYLDKFDESSYIYFDRFELSEELNNSILGVNEDGELVALRADTGFYIFNTMTNLKSPIYGNNSIEGYSFYSFLPPGKAFLYGVHHPSSGGSYTDLHVRGTDGNNNVISLDLKSPSDAPQYYKYHAPISSPDGNYIAAGYSDFTSNRILVWKTAANEIYYEINDLPATITTLDISPDMETLAAAGKDCIIRLWNLETAEFIETITDFNAPIISIQYSEDGKELSISTEDRKSYIYNFALKQLKQVYESEELNHSLILQKIEEGYLLENDEKGKFTPSPASLVFSPDGSRIALIQGSVQVWDIDNPSFIASFLPDNRFRFTNATFDTAGERLAILSDRGEVYVWNIETGKTELHIPYEKMLDKQAPFSADNVAHAVDNDLSDFSNQNIVFSPDGQQIAFANGMNIEIWNIVLAAKNKTLSTDGLSGRPEKLVFSEDGETITAVTSTDQYLVTWNIRSGEIIDQFELIYSARTHGKTTNLSNSHFASLNHTDSDDWIDLWNLQTYESVKLELANNTLFSSAFNTDGTLFTAIDNANNLYIWRTDTGQLLYYEKGFSINSTLAINPSGTILATAEDGQITFWDLAPITEKGFRDGFVSPTLIPEEQNGGFTFVTEPAVTPTMAAATATQQQTQTEQEPTAAETKSTQQAVENPDNESPLLKVQQNQGIVTSIQWQNDKVLLSSTTGLYAYDLAKENLSLIFSIEEMDISSIEGLANANYLSAGMANKDQIQLWNPTKPEQLLSAAGSAAPVISPNKKLMAYYLGNFRYMLWNISEEKSQFILTGYGPSASIAFSPDSKYVAIAQNTGLVQVWDTTKGTIEYAFNGGNAACSTIHFSSDGKTLLCITPGSVWIWPLADDAQPVEIEVYATQSSANDDSSNHYITAADVNYSNEIIAIADDTGTIRFYTLGDQNLNRNMSQPEVEITQLVFAPKDNRLATVDVNGHLAIWDADTSEMVSELNFFNGTINGMRTLDDRDIAVWTKTQLSIFDPETLEIRSETQVSAAEILDVSTNGKWAAAYTPNAIQLFDLNSGDLLTTLAHEEESNTQIFYRAAFSANNETLICFGTGGAWIYKLNQSDVSKTSLLGNIEASQIHLAALNSDGSRFILSPGEGYLRPKVYETTKLTGLVDIALAKYQTNLIAGQEYTAYAFHPDNVRVVLLRSGLYADARLEIASLSTGNNLTYLSYENTNANVLALNQDGSQIAVGFDTGQIRIYDADQLSILHEFYAHPASVSHLAFSNDGTYLFSSGEEGSIKSWIIE